MSRNFHELDKDEKAALKPVVESIRKQLYGDAENIDLLEEGLVINFGKKKEERHTVKLELV